MHCHMHTTFYIDIDIHIEMLLCAHMWQGEIATNL